MQTEQMRTHTIFESKRTTRPLSEDENETLKFLRTLNENWLYVGVVGNYKLFSLTLFEKTNT